MRPSHLHLLSNSTTLFPSSPFCPHPLFPSPVPVSTDEEDSDKEEQEEGFIAPETVEAPVKGRRYEKRRKEKRRDGMGWDRMRRDGMGWDGNREGMG